MFSGDMEEIEKYQVRFLEMKTTMLEMKKKYSRWD